MYFDWVFQSEVGDNLAYAYLSQEDLIVDTVIGDYWFFMSGCNRGIVIWETGTQKAMSWVQADSN